MVGIVTIIPNMITAIPESLNSFGSKNSTLEEKIIAPPVEEEEVSDKLKE